MGDSGDKVAAVPAAAAAQVRPQERRGAHALGEQVGGTGRGGPDWRDKRGGVTHLVIQVLSLALGPGRMGGLDWGRFGG
jgi:hypothetical protein